MKTTVVNAKKQHYDVFIGRPSLWGNPFVVGVHGSRSQVISLYRQHVWDSEELRRLLPTLTGKRLGCFCKPQMCHGDVLAELADRQCPTCGRLGCWGCGVYVSCPSYG